MRRAAALPTGSDGSSCRTAEDTNHKPSHLVNHGDKHPPTTCCLYVQLAAMLDSVHMTSGAKHSLPRLPDQEQPPCATYCWFWVCILQKLIAYETFCDADNTLARSCCCRYHSWCLATATATVVVGPSDDRDQASRVEVKEPLWLVVELVVCDLMKCE